MAEYPMPTIFCDAPFYYHVVTHTCTMRMACVLVCRPSDKTACDVMQVSVESICGKERKRTSDDSRILCAFGGRVAFALVEALAAPYKAYRN